MRAKRVVIVALAAFIASAGVGVALNWKAIQEIWQRSNPSSSGVVWLEGSTNGGVFPTLASPLRFVSLPQNLADYRDLGSERVQSIAANDSLVVVGTRGGGVSLSVDNAASWYTATTANGLGSNSIFSAFIDGERIYIGSEFGVSWSDTMGRKWESRSFENAQSRSGVRVVSVYAREQNIFAGTHGSGIKISRDAGKTWFSGSEKGFDAGVVWALVGYEGSIFAATERGIYISRDDGETWPEHIVAGDSGLPGNSIQSLAVCDSQIYAGTAQGLFRSESLKGNEWKELSFSGWPPHGGVVSIAAVKRENAPRCSILVGLLSAGVGYSQNGGSGWIFENEHQGLKAEDINTVAFAKDVILAGSTVEGLFVSEKIPGNWKHIGAPRIIANPPVQDVAIMGASIFVATADGVAISVDGGGNWTKKSLFGDTKIAVNRVFVENQELYAIAGDKLCQLSAAGELMQTWSPSQFGFAPSDGGFTGFAQSGNTVVVSTENGGVSISKNGMKGPWALRSASDVGNLKVNFVRIVDGKIYVATQSTLALSQDLGETWEKVTFGAFSVEKVDAEGDKIAVALKGSGIGISPDGGHSWRTVRAHDGLIDDVVNEVLINKGMLIVATSKGISSSYDWGKRWFLSTVGNGLGNENVLSVAVVGNRIFAGTEVGLSFAEFVVK